MFHRMSRPAAVRASFSPHTRGCSVYEQDETGWHLVFPAYAGMFRTPPPPPHPRLRFPRIRGDVPARPRRGHDKRWFSPHTRGCSFFRWWPRCCLIVFPAYAGMFRRPGLLPLLTSGFPRIRGDVPCIFAKRLIMETFSPHTRGCSFFQTTRHLAVVVFPAYAGMFLRPENDSHCNGSFPRIRGDVPQMADDFRDTPGFSPHTRGCSERAGT